MTDDLVLVKGIVTLLADGTGKPVGLMDRPRTGPAQDSPYADPPYAVLWPQPGGSYADGLADTARDRELVFQVTCIGRRGDQALWLRDRVVRTWLTRAPGGWLYPLTYSTATVIGREHRADGASDTESGIFSVSDVFALRVTT